MVDRELLELVGLDPEDPDVQASLQDAQYAQALVDDMVKARKDRGLSQGAVAERMETTQSAVSKLERAGSDPRLSTLQRYSRAVNCRLRMWLEIDGGVKHYPVPIDSDVDEDADEDVYESVQVKAASR